MKLADYIAMAWLLSMLLFVLLSPFVLLGILINHLIHLFK